MEGLDQGPRYLLEQQPGTVAFDQTAVEVATQRRWACEDADQETANEATDQVNTNDIECIVVTELELHPHG